MAYLIPIFLNAVMLVLIPEPAFQSPRVIVIPILMLYFSVLYAFFTQHPGFNSLKKSRTDHVLILAAIGIALALQLATQTGLTLASTLKITFIYAIPLLLLIPTRTVQRHFHPVDFLVFLAIFLPLELNLVRIPMIYQKNVIAFDGLFMTSVLLTLFVYLANRKIDMGHLTVNSWKSWRETFLLTLGLLFLEILIGLKLHFLHFTGWEIAPRQTLIVTLFMFLNGALLEEIFFRGLIYNYLEQFLKKYHTYLPLLINTVLFGVTHLNNGGLPMLLLSSLAGFFYCLVYMRSRSILQATFIHATVNVVWKLFFV